MTYVILLLTHLPANATPDSAAYRTLLPVHNVTEAQCWQMANEYQTRPDIVFAGCYVAGEGV